MAEFNLDRFKYNWKGNWQSSFNYDRDDIVRFGGISYVCLITHTSDTNFYTDLEAILPGSTPPQPLPKWTVMTVSSTFVGDWQTSTAYRLNDIVIYEGSLYICEVRHTSTTFGENSANWTIFAEGTKFRADWSESTTYGVNSLVRYNGIVYKCIEEHISQSTTAGLEADQEKWEMFFDGYEWKGLYTDGIRYRPNDLVLNGGTVFKCVTGHTSTTVFADENWTREFPGFDFDADWLNSTYYQEGDIVRYGGFLYYAIANNIDQNPSVPNGDDSTVSWIKLMDAINFRGNWSSDNFYRTGDIVRRGGDLWKALVDISPEDGSTLDYIEEDQPWELIVRSTDWKGLWTQPQAYNLNDLVIYQGNNYICTESHISTNNNFPGDNGSGFNYWDIFIQAGQQIGMSESGDLLTFNLDRTLQGDGSSFGPTRIAIGQVDQILTVNNNDSAIWEDYDSAATVVYVAQTGIDDEDDPDRGINIYKPFRTVKFALEYVDRNITTLSKVYIATGIYDEVLPLIVPARCAVVGDELRSTVINANAANELLAKDSFYAKLALLKVREIIQPVLLNQAVTVTPGNSQPQNTNLPASNPETVNRVQQLINAISAYIEFNIEGTGSNPTLTSTNTQNTDTAIINAKLILQANKKFIAAEAAAYSDQTFRSNITSANGVTNRFTGSTAFLVQDAPITFTTTIGGVEIGKVYYVKQIFSAIEFSVSEAPAGPTFSLTTAVGSNVAKYFFDTNNFQKNIRHYVNSWIYDIEYTGNYKTLLSARYYRNEVLGSNLEDMFYVRDATGVRNMTVTGLSGVLNPPGVFDFFQRPTAGSYVSLDPGWGPADNRTWILNRSPYIQGVTTIGTACIGQKVDGSLHNGGNKSITSNDFTQVLSDGIGAWILNNGRAELVSVFTYYCQVGYLATNGGIIRATNGNNSYGTFGAVAEGIDLNEIPKAAKVNNRENEAQVNQAFAGEVNDFLLAFEYSHCGEEYTTATANIRGSGNFADLVYEEKDFRDGGLFEARIINSNESGGAGGAGYTLEGNNAQTGNLTSITLATADDGTPADYIGQRIVITSGVGTGQYGYIQNYNDVSKVATVYRESDNNLGWDHVIPGTPLANPLITNTTYRIEPRMTVNHPGYSAVNAALPANTNWIDVAYGDTIETYTNVSNQQGSGETEGVTPIAAVFTVVKNGKIYSVTTTNAGAGYAIGDTIVIAGDDLGGATPANDLTIRVTEVTDDSTSSIVSFTSRGVGASGRFVTIASGNTNAAYSPNGINWTASNLPTTGDWIAVAAGNNRFVAIRSNSSLGAYSLDGKTWISMNMPTSANWKDIAYGGGRFVAITENNNVAAYSTNGVNWIQSNLPTGDDSSGDQWTAITYGQSKFVAISASQTRDVAYSTNGITWQRYNNVLPAGDNDWVSLTYGAGRFVAVSANNSAVTYSLEGNTWYNATLPSLDGSTHMNWKKIRYGHGVFFAVCDTGSRDIGADTTVGPTTYAATSEDGIFWTERELSFELQWNSVAFGNPENVGTWVAVSNNPIGEGASRILTGCRAKVRANVSIGVFDVVKIWDPGSGYTQANPPVITTVDNAATVELVTENRFGNGVLPQPSFVNRGVGYRTSSTTVTINGDGFADIIPTNNSIVLDNLEVYPGPGAQLLFATILDEDTLDPDDLKIYTAVVITQLGEDNTGNGTFKARFQISPRLTIEDDLRHNTNVSIRERYSQCRITGHDFLDIGTGNFEETNYPALYAGGAFFVNSPENEVVEENGGRVFYTSTDQEGNFRAGELFSVQQATGIVTISAEFFDLDGLSELALGGVRLGGSGAVVREFSTDVNFTEDSNNVVPTQRAIATFLQNRLSQGGSELETGTIIAGVVRIGNIGTTEQFIDTTTGIKIIFPRRMDFSGNAEISGSIIAQQMFLRSFDD